MAPSIDVVVAVHDHYELTCKCLEHLARQTVAHRAIVVDDGSSDGTPERLRRDWPEATVVELAANCGYTRAVNRGVSAGAGECVVLLNNDVRLRPDCLELLVAPLADDPRVGSVAAAMLRPGERTIDSVGVSADATLAGFARLQGRPVADAALRAPVLTGPEGTAGAYRRTAWEQAGGLDETIVAYMEILDLALRLRTAGWIAASAPDARGVHLGSSTYGRRSSRQRRMAGFSRGYLLRRYGVLRGRACARALLTETAVVVADLAICHDIQALRGRVEGWRAGAGLKRHARPPDEAIDRSISLWKSLQLRRSAVESP
ncbi:MAG TPA: glycosyltransferase family 2 protein [Solirubrobacteraceae bacterium]|jgi:N-acetylglucosaminyl-diphospho-decaprenol L-rhamnosyltransferase|nr:glycosyltransferase family 2 protein [Solirubrobacteraceae bacterium]